MSGALALAPGRREISSSSNKGGKEGRRQPQQRQLPGVAVLLCFLFFCFNPLFIWAPLSGIKGSKETCSKNTRDDKMQTNEHKYKTGTKKYSENFSWRIN